MTASAEEVIPTTRRVLADHPITFALLFGSAARGEAAETSDVDLAVEFADHVRDDGYSDAYLGLVEALEDALGTDVDVVPVSAMDPSFAAVAFDEGVVVVGPEERRRELAKAIAGELPSTAESSERVAAAAARLVERSS